MGTCGSKVCVGKKSASQQAGLSTIKTNKIKPIRRQDLDSSTDIHEEDIQDTPIVKTWDQKPIKTVQLPAQMNLHDILSKKHEDW